MALMSFADIKTITWYDEYLSRRTVTFQLSFKCHLWGITTFHVYPVTIHLSAGRGAFMSFPIWIICETFEDKRTHFMTTKVFSFRSVLSHSQS